MSLIKKIKLGFFALTILFLGCAKKFEPANPDLFYDIVYVALYSRLPNVGTWVPVQGEFKIKFTQDKTGETKDGVFTIFYSSYFEPQFCGYNLSCVCSGGVKGKFTNVEDQIQPDKTDSPYNIFDQYPTTTDSTAVDPTTGKVVEIKNFKFDLKIELANLAIGCKNEADRQIRFSRFADGSVIMLNDYREIYLVPEVVL